MTTDPSLEAAVLNNDLSTLDRITTTTTTSSSSPLDALRLSARLARPQSFSHLLTQHPSLTSSLTTDPLLLDALTGSSVPIWRIILEHDPLAKNRRFGHFGTVVERCVTGDKKELLEFLLEKGAKVERPARPILLKAEICGASQEIKDLLVRYGARTDFADEEEGEGGEEGG